MSVHARIEPPPVAPTRPAPAEPADPVAAWLGVLTTLLRLPPREARSIRDELEAHLRDRIDDLMLSGQSEAEATRRAIAELGEAASLAARFREVNASSRRRRIMNVSALVLAGGAAVVSLFALNQSGGATAPYAVYPSAVAPAGSADDLSSIRFTGELRDVPLAAVFERMGRAAGLPVHVNWGSFSNADFGPDTPVTVSMGEVSLPRLMALLGQQLTEAPEDRPDIRASDGTLWIASRGFIDHAEVTLVSYDLRAVVAGLREAADDERSAGELVETIAETLQTLVEPDGWVDNGGSLALQTWVGSTLFVKAPPRYHDQIRWVLGQLPAAGGGHSGLELLVVPTFRDTGDGATFDLGWDVRRPEGDKDGPEDGGE